MTSLNKMLCLVDGEHYLPVTQEAIDTLNNKEIIEKVATKNGITEKGLNFLDDELIEVYRNLIEIIM